jgi:hypothetical protein
MKGTTLITLLMLTVSACSGAASDTPTTSVSSTSLVEVTATTVPNPSTVEESCTPDSTVAGTRWEEAQATTNHAIEVWALFFYPLPRGKPISLPSGEELKIVWRATGDGKITIDAEGPNGIRLASLFGPEPHGGSNWDRPGEEWGTGWLFPEPGCWTFHIQRGGEATATLTISVTG